MPARPQHPLPSQPCLPALPPLSPQDEAFQLVDKLPVKKTMGGPPRRPQQGRGWLASNYQVFTGWPWGRPPPNTQQPTAFPPLGAPFCHA
jgi:hypothetical protein